MRALTIVVVAVTLLVGSGRVHAQSGEDKAAADTLFKDARALLAAGRASEACPKFEASQHLDPAPGTELNLGDCYEKLGRFASAWATFRQAADDFQHVSDAVGQKAAHDRAAALEPRLSRLTIQPPKASIVGLVVMRNGVIVDAVLLGTPIPVDAGPQKIECHAPGRKGWTQELSVNPGDSMVAAVPDLVVDATTLVGKGGGKAGESDLQITVGERSETYDVELATTGGMLRCDGSVTRDKPCKLRAPPGPAVMTVRGAATLTEDMTLKGKPMLVTVEKTSRYLLYGGAASAGAGAIALGVGLYACSQSADTGSATGLTCIIGSSFGGAAVIAGGVMVVMDLVADHHEVSVRTEGDDDDQAALDPRPRRPRPHTLYTTPIVGGAVLGLTGSF